MKAVLKQSDLCCGRCGQPLYSGARAVRCLNKHCIEYQIRYEYPSIELDRIPDVLRKPLSVSSE